MEKHLFSLSFSLVFCLFSCNSSNTGTTTQKANQTIPEAKSVFINGDSIHYVDVGNGDPIVLVHGVMDDYRTWDAQMDDFSRNNRVIAYSLRGGYPNKQILDSAVDYSLNQNTKDLIEFLKTIKLGPVHLVGHSSGAFASLLTTIEHPEIRLHRVTTRRPNTANSDTL